MTQKKSHRLQALSLKHEYRHPASMQGNTHLDVLSSIFARECSGLQTVVLHFYHKELGLFRVILHHISG
jgi:hypothetical protein